MIIEENRDPWIGTYLSTYSILLASHADFENVNAQIQAGHQAQFPVTLCPSCMSRTSEQKASNKVVVSNTDDYYRVEDSTSANSRDWTHIRGRWPKASK